MLNIEFGGTCIWHASKHAVLASLGVLVCRATQGITHITVRTGKAHILIPVDS